jgi:predicted DNA-binding transcriptional regulator AlpA
MSTPWVKYCERETAVSAAGYSLVEAFAQLVLARTGFPKYELAEIFTCPEDDGEADAARDLVRVQAEMLATEFALGAVGTIARPIGGGDRTAIPPVMWELDDPLPRFATGELNLESWTDANAEPTHRIFVNRDQFDQFLVTVGGHIYLTSDQVASAVDPHFRARRDLSRKFAPEVQNSEQPNPSATDGKSREFAPDLSLVPINQVMKMTGMGRTSVYKQIDRGHFPQPVKIGSRSGWPKAEVLDWINAKMAGRY